MTQQEFDRLAAITKELLAIADKTHESGGDWQSISKVAVDCGVLALNNGRDTEQEIAHRLHKGMTEA